MKLRLYNLICTILIILIFFNLCISFQVISQAANKNSCKTVIIDPGHGGEDGGAVANNGIMEKDINLKISLYLKEIFEQNGFYVIMTRETDTDLSDKNLSTVSSRKKSDILKRTEICNKTDACFVLSIHQNHFSENKYAGAQMFFGKNENSIKLAQSIQTEIINKLQLNNNREVKPGNDIYLLENVTKPIIIAECGFISNETDLKNLTNNEYIKQLALVIYMGCAKYLSEAS